MHSMAAVGDTDDGTDAAPTNTYDIEHNDGTRTRVYADTPQHGVQHDSEIPVVQEKDAPPTTVQQQSPRNDDHPPDIQQHATPMVNPPVQ